MTADASPSLAAHYACHVFEASAMIVAAGANVGDALAGLDALCLGDVYELSEGARTRRLAIHDAPAGSVDAGRFLNPWSGRALVARGSEVGATGAALDLEARLTLMAPDSGRSEILLIAVPEAGGAGGPLRVFLPLSPLEPGVEYTLIAATVDTGPVALANVVSVAFTRGTCITLADGTQRAVEQLRPGDRVLTRDNGPQPVRHVLSRTVRAVGAFAPVSIPRGVLGNANDLIVSQDQRFFLYQRGPDRLADRAEVLVRALDLVDDDTVTLRKGGYADYVSLVFDRHEVIYAECIPAESLLVNDATRRQLPEDERQALADTLPGLSQAPVRAAEPTGAALAGARHRLLRGAKDR